MSTTQISQKLFKSAIDAVTPFVNARSTLPILSHIKIDSTGDALIFAASNTEAQIEHSITCSGSPFSACASATLLKRFAALCEEDVSLAYKSGKIHLKSGQADARLAVSETHNFPLIKKTENIIAEIDWQAVKEKIAFASMFCADADIRPQMNCVQIRANSNRIDIFGTNGFRLGINGVPYISPEFNLCIPVQSTRLMVGDFQSFVVRENQIELRGNNTTAVFKTAPYQTLDARRISDVALPNSGQVYRESLMNAIAFAAAFDDSKLRSAVKVEATDKNFVQLISTNHEAVTSFDYEGERFSLMVYSSDFIDALKALDGEKIKIEFNAANASTAHIRLKDGQRTILAMPIRN
jgi:DNA polymerase-3 subunit beta